ncbi:MAG: acyltransferase domain-containing protein [Streptosporangiaceae bacterium]
MSVETVFLLPGQGGYSPGAFAGEAAPEVAEVLAVVDRVAAEFGRDGVSRLLTEPDAPGPAELMRSDSFALQLAVFAAGVCWFRLAARGATPDVVVGHSMGEIAALTVAGAFDLADGARLVCHRSEALLAHCPEDGGMVALELAEPRAAHLVGAVAERGLAVAVANAPRQTVVSGPDGAVATVASLAETLGVRVTRLTAPFPFHSPMLALAAHAFAHAITGIRQRPPHLGVYSPTAGGHVRGDTDLKALLARQLTTAVQFLAAVRELHAAGAETFVECGDAGLSGLVRRSVPAVSTSKSTSAPAEPVVIAPAPAGGVLEELRELYAVSLGYPVEVITADADLEADLGIDSLKRAEMLAKVSAHFGLGESAQDGRFIAQPTLAALADLIAVTPAEAR